MPTPWVDATGTDSLVPAAAEHSELPSRLGTRRANVPRVSPSSEPEARRALVEFARQYDRRKEALDQELQQLQEERDAIIRRAFRNGVSTREIARLLGGISHQRVAQIVQ